MNPKLHTVLRIAFALFLIISGAKHLYTVYWGDPTIMATGYPETGGRGVCACRARNEVFVAVDQHDKGDRGRAHADA